MLTTATSGINRRAILLNRLISVTVDELDPRIYTWDNNGNLLSDGINTYTYDPANRLTDFSDGNMSYQYAYNGLGNRLQQTQNGQTIPYALDLNAGLPQVLNDGTYTYLYGYDRIAQYGASGMDYFLPDALGSVRQMTDAVGGVTLSQSFTPYGELLARGGIGSTVYDFAGEWTDPSGLQYLRARYYAPNTGTFISRDPWSGNVRQPASLNRYMYVQGNPVNFSDPSGLCRPDDYACQKVADRIYNKFKVYIKLPNGIPSFITDQSNLQSIIDYLGFFDPCLINVFSDSNYWINRPIAWNTFELLGVERVLDALSYFIGPNEFMATIGNRHTSIQKVFYTTDPNHNVPETRGDSKNMFPYSYYESTISLPIIAFSGASNADEVVARIGPTLFHESMHAFDNSTAVWYHIGNYGTYRESDDPFWATTSKLYYRGGIPCGGATVYSCTPLYPRENPNDSAAGENFADSAAVYALYWLVDNAPSVSQIYLDAKVIRNNYLDAANPKQYALPPDEWRDDGRRRARLHDLFGK